MTYHPPPTYNKKKLARNLLYKGSRVRRITYNNHQTSVNRKHRKL